MNEESTKRGARRAVVKKAVSLPISEVKTRVTPKKVTVKKTVTKKVATKKSLPKTTTKVDAEKVTQKRGIKSPFSSEVMAEVTETNVDRETVKMVTGPLSPRLKEKLALYEMWYRNEAPKYAEGAAKVFGYGFIVSGFLLAFTLTAQEPLMKHGLVATLECSLTGCPELTASSTEVVTPLILPTVTFVTAPVVVPKTDTDVAFTVANAASHSFSITSHDTGITTQLEAAGNDGAGMYMYRLPTRELAPGDYEITVRATAYDTTTKTEFTGGIFTVPTTSPRVAETPITSEAATTTEETVATTSDEVIAPTDSAEQATSTELIESLDETEVAAGLVLGVSSSTEEVTSSPQETDDKETETVRDEVFDITITPGILDNQYKVFITPTYEYSTVELSIRALNSTAPLYLGQATVVKDGWLYWLDASALPAGSYKVVVSGLDTDVVKDSAEVQFNNVVSAPLYLMSPEYEEVKKALATDVETLSAATTSDLASFSDPRITHIPDLLSSTPGLTADGEATALISVYADELNPLLRTYAGARQSGDVTALRLSEAAIDDLITTILDTELVDSAESVLFVESELRVALTQLKERITTIENYKKERTAAASSVDTDEDGIADYDEYLLYDTDPKEADTDRDGVIDGVEVALQYDPADASPQAVIRLSDPTATSYVDDAVLSVTSVTPVLVYEANATEPFVQSEISGFGLPNSFISLFIYGEPSVVVVKTDTTGRFSHTFTKLLPDGQHEIYATLIDNTGSIVLRSSAFRFAKAGTNYTYPKDVPQTAALWSAPALTSNTTTYNLVATMGVIAFGLILLLMALALRQDRLKPVPSTTS